VTSASVTSGWSQNFVYDGFGNLTGKTGTGGAPSWVPANGVNPANNRLLGLTYDDNGNQVTIPMTAGMTDAFTATYDPENRMTVIANASQSRKSEYDYDPSNKRVWERRTGGPDAGEWVYFFGADGSRIGRYAVTVSGSSVSLSQDQVSVWFAGRLVQKMGVSGSSPTWPNADRLGSVGKYLPYGEDKPGASGIPANDNEKFATYTRDKGTGIDYADQRWYGQGTGRLISPDGFLGSGVLDNPATLNRYGYVLGDPANLVDVDGRIPCGSGTRIGSDGRIIVDVYECIGWIPIFPQDRRMDTPPLPDPTSKLGLNIGISEQKWCHTNRAPGVPARFDVSSTVAAAMTLIQSTMTDLWQTAQTQNPENPSAQYVTLVTLWFNDQVKTNGPWDWKNRPEFQGADYQDFGNWFYGVVGSHIYDSMWFIQSAAGYAQQRSNPLYSDGGIPFLDPPFGHSIRDQNWIFRGAQWNGSRCPQP
jgi:RHS repeat-associated protein